MPDGVIDLTAESFGVVLDPGAGTWIVDFWADWCAPCHVLEPVLQDLALDDESIHVGRLDVSLFATVGDRWQVRSLPTLIVFQDGAEVRRLFGPKTKRA